MKLDVNIHQSLAGIPASDWNQLGEADYPFTRHEFLLALEQHQCLSEFGWQSVYIVLQSESKIIAGMACYIKFNSYGELVFDHNWAQSYQRSGRDYYPKLVTAIPYTPATGPRFLIHRAINDPNEILQLRMELLRVIKRFCSDNRLSGWHLLFEREQTVKALAGQDLLYRYDCQFHWHNDDYSNFDDFLSRLSSRKRKNIRKERASVATENLLIERKHGDELTDADWQQIHKLYAGIFDRKYGTATLSEGFFKAIGPALQGRVMAVLVKKDDSIIATSLFFVSDSTLYGRVWGCDEYYNHLHFECCYYQGIEYCIENKLQHFDPGAQGEHKISRGFLPTRTCSAHWFVDQDFHQMIAHYLLQEEAYINEYCQALALKSPYRRTS